MKLAVMKVISRRVLLIMGIAAIAVMSTGCQMMANGLVKHYSAKAWEETRVKMGINTEPPHIASITSYGTQDPELQIFLSYIGALGNPVEGVSGKDMDANDFENMLKRTENDVRKAYDNVSTMSADQKLALAEKITDGMRKAGPPKYLNVLPVGADPKMSILSSSIAIYPDPTVHTLNQKSSTISVFYKFKTLEEMSQKAQDINNKLKSVIAGQQGWKTLDLAVYKAQVYDNRLLAGTNASPEYKRNFAEQSEKTIKSYQAGQASMQYSYESRYRLKDATSNFPAIDMYLINVVPILEPLNGFYELYVGFATNIAEPREGA